jgi:hypothetical protein
MHLQLDDAKRGVPEASAHVKELKGVLPVIGGLKPDEEQRKYYSANETRVSLSCEAVPNDAMANREWALWKTKGEAWWREQQRV